MTARAQSARVLLATVTMALAIATALFAQRPARHLDRNGVALGGYDAVAYFTESRAVKGSQAHEFSWDGATWRFATADHRDRFARDPQRFAPRFGGYCAYAVSRGYTASGDPEAWSVVNGRLYINYSQSVRSTWEKDTPANIAKGDANWPGVLEK